MYGLPLVGRLADRHITMYLHSLVPITHGLWVHTTANLALTFVVHNCVVNRIDQSNAEQFICTLNLLHSISEGTKYWALPGMTLIIPVISPCEDTSNLPSSFFNKHVILTQNILWTKGLRLNTPVHWIFHPCKTLQALNAYKKSPVSGCIFARSHWNLTTEQDHETRLNYAATHPDAQIWLIARNRMLNMYSNAVYYVAPKACSRFAGNHYPTDY